ncbi:MAG TPA: hypothetical protein VFN75_09660 [Pseudonocardiaceae bacterium]|nr:hypothetical protein [Pseudonocardiaceae bacterium]
MAFTLVNRDALSFGAPLTPGEALAELFLTNADKGYDAENHALVAELLKRMRAIQALTANPSGR